MELEKRFWEKVEKRGDNDCWIWKGTKQKNGYGRIKVDGKSLLAHRLSYELNMSKIPNGLWVLHKCDNPKCVNPNHLFLGNRSDNMKDAFKKGRMIWGGQNKKFTIKEIDYIKNLKGKNVSNRKIGDLMNVSHSTINDIINNRYYKNLGSSTAT